MSLKKATVGLLGEALGQEINFLVLRGLDDWARDEGDIDVLVPNGLSKQALLRVTERAVDAGWAVAGVRDIGYLTQVCLVQRWDEDRAHRAVKVDFFNGLTWGDLGTDPLGHFMFEGLHDPLPEAEAIGVVTFLQKMLYAGYLRERDRKRIEEACTPEQIRAFFNATGLPLSLAELESGRLSLLSKWRLRAASAGVNLTGMPMWSLRVIWRRLRFALIRSNLSGCIVLITGADDNRRSEVTEQLQSLIERAGFPSLIVIPSKDANLLSLAWLKFRGDTLIIQDAFSGTVGADRNSLTSMLQVELSALKTSTTDDLGRVLSAISQHILVNLRARIQS